MADWSGVLEVTQSVLNLFGTYEAASGARNNGRRQQVEKQFEQQQLDDLATAAMGNSMRAAAEERRQADLVASRALAVAAASGGAADPQIVRLIGNIKGEGAYRSALKLYEGEWNARKLRMAGATAGLEGALAVEAGNNKARAYEISGLSNAVSGAISWADKYGWDFEGNGTSGSGDGALIRPSNQG